MKKVLEGICLKIPAYLETFIENSVYLLLVLSSIWLEHQCNGGSISKKIGPRIKIHIISNVKRK